MTCIVFMGMNSISFVLGASVHDLVTCCEQSVPWSHFARNSPFVARVGRVGFDNGCKLHQKLIDEDRVI